MRCGEAHVLLSARLDGELAADEEVALAAHVTSCARCTAHADRLARLHGRLRVQVAEPVPDLTASIIDRQPDRRRPARHLVPDLDLPQAVLLVVALTELALCVPALVGGVVGAPAAHVGRELAAFNVAFAVGLLVAVWQPRRAAGLVPMAAALAGAMTLVGLADLVSGTTTVMDEAYHVLELVGIGALWAVARRTPDGGARPVLA
jgi:predicted anti-sigma-YlaC factor YlaD